MTMIRVRETALAMLPCPCGCGGKSEQHDGMLGHGHGGSHYRLVLMRAADGEPMAQLSIGAVTLACNRDGARIADPKALAKAETPEFYFACFDALMAQHSRLMEFLLE